MCIKYHCFHFSKIVTDVGDDDVQIIVGYAVMVVFFVACVGLSVVLVCVIWRCKNVRKSSFLHDTSVYVYNLVKYLYMYITLELLLHVKVSDAIRMLCMSDRYMYMFYPTLLVVTGYEVVNNVIFVIKTKTSNVVKFFASLG